MSHPLLSIVIANYNYGRFLGDAIQSVALQDMRDKVELIICDAASTDNSVDVIKKYAKGLPSNVAYSDWIATANHSSQESPLITWWCSEKDRGQSAAFNKGFSHARGRFLTWLNADDVIMPGTLKAFEKTVEQNPMCEWFVGGVMWLDKDMRIIKCGRGRPFSKLRADMGSLSVWGPSSFFAKSLFERAGGVDESFEYTMDTELWMRFYNRCSVRYLPFIDYAWGLRIHEDAKTSSQFFVCGESDKEINKRMVIRDEMNKIFARYKPPLSQNFLRFVRSVNVWGSLMGRLDTIFNKGRRYESYFGRGGK